MVVWLEIMSVYCFAVLKENLSSVVKFLAKPGSIAPHSKAKAEVYVLSKDEGGRHTPFFNGYRPQFFFFGTADVTGVIKLLME